MEINAVAHADYRQHGAPIRVAIFDDRLEVESPGLLPFGLTVDDLHRGVSKLRNRVIGIRFRVTLFTTRVAAPTMDETDQAILNVLTENGAPTSEVAAAISLSTRATRTRLARLVERGFVREIGTSPSDPRRRYYPAT